jgi:CBS domain-containing protein
MDEYFATDIMKEQVVVIDSSATAMDAAKKMTQDNIGCVVVMERDSPVGILTERDFVRKIAVNKMSLSTPVKDVMSAPLISIDPDATIWELAELMKIKKIHKVPVIRENNLIGIVTTSDIVRLCSIGSDSGLRQVCQQILSRLHQS